MECLGTVLFFKHRKIAWGKVIEMELSYQATDWGKQIE
jgi:hypothetical protein